MKNVVRLTVTLIKDGEKKSYITDIPEVMEELNLDFKLHIENIRG